MHRSKQRADCNALFNHLVGAGEQRRGHVEAELLPVWVLMMGSKLSRLHNGQVRRFGKASHVLWARIANSRHSRHHDKGRLLGLQMVHPDV